jgi:hypothetical protein
VHCTSLAGCTVIQELLLRTARTVALAVSTGSAFRLTQRSEPCKTTCAAHAPGSGSLTPAVQTSASNNTCRTDPVTGMRCSPCSALLRPINRHVDCLDKPDACVNMLRQSWKYLSQNDTHGLLHSMPCFIANNPCMLTTRSSRKHCTIPSHSTALHKARCCWVIPSGSASKSDLLRLLLLPATGACAHPCFPAIPASRTHQHITQRSHNTCDDTHSI